MSPSAPAEAKEALKRAAGLCCFWWLAVWWWWLWRCCGRWHCWWRWGQCSAAWWA